MKEKGATVMTKKERLAYWQGIIDEYRDSGLSGAAFCREHNINPGRFYHWRRRLQDDDLQEAGGFFELVPCAPSNHKATVHVQLPNGIVIEVGRGFDPVTLRGVIETVSSIRPCSQ
jgi:hypothetical protein